MSRIADPAPKIRIGRVVRFEAYAKSAIRDLTPFFALQNFLHGHSWHRSIVQSTALRHKGARCPLPA